MTRPNLTRSSSVLLPLMLTLGCGSESPSPNAETSEAETAAETEGGSSGSAADGKARPRAVPARATVSRPARVSLGATAMEMATRT